MHARILALAWLLAVPVGGCSSGQADPCAGVVCNQPPGPACDGRQLLTYADVGVCADGDCVYDVVPQLCPAACVTDHCTDNPCQGVVCTKPPADSCDGTDYVLSYPATGQCDAQSGLCVYQPQRLPCPAGCSNGTCPGCKTADDCQSDPPTCKDGTHLETHQPQCISSQCQPATQTVDCAANGRTCQNGTCVGGGIRAPKAGEVIITEFMPNPKAVADNLGEWFEIHSLAGETLELSGVKVHDDGTSSFVISAAASLPIAPGAYLVLGINGDQATNGGVKVDFDYGAFLLANSADAIVLAAPDGTEIDAVRYDVAKGWVVPNGASLHLLDNALDATANDDPASWCPSADAYGLGDRGTPGAPDGACIQCQQPSDCQVPPPECRDNTQLASFTASCTNGTCSETQQLTDCAQSGQVCRDGACASAHRSPAPGELVISEFMANPSKVSDTNGEWFEVANTTAEALNMGGLVFHDDGSNRFTIPSDQGISIAPNGRFVLASNGDPTANGGLKPDYVYSNFTLTNTKDAIVMELASVGLIDAVRYDTAGGWLVGNGKSTQLRENFLTATGNDTAANWCQTTLTYGAGDYGTPGQLNTNCAAR